METMSKPEKAYLSIIQKEEPELNVPLVERQLPNGCSDLFYEFQNEEEKWEAVKTRYPFLPPFENPNEMRTDIHAHRQIRIGDCELIRYNNRNMVVSPLYAQYGGMAIDIYEEQDEYNHTTEE